MERFVLQPTLRRVVAPAAKGGWCVDYFLQLSGTWNGEWLDTVYKKGGGPQPVASPYQSMSQEYFTSTVVKQAVVHGAHHISVRLLVDGDRIDPITPDGLIVQGERFFAYPPLKSSVGRNQLRRLKAVEELWNHSMAYAGTNNYDLVLLSRDDVYWAGDMDLDWFARDIEGSEEKMYTYYCEYITEQWLGDKVRIMSGRIADKMMRMYSDIYHNAHTLMDKVHTAEHLLFRAALIHDVTFAQVRFSKLPFYVVQYFELEGYGLTLCLRYAHTLPCLNGSIHDVMHGRFGPACFLDPRRKVCMGAMKLQIPGCGNFFHSTKRYDNRLDYR